MGMTCGYDLQRERHHVCSTLTYNSGTLGQIERKLSSRPARQMVPCAAYCGREDLMKIAIQNEWIRTIPSSCGDVECSSPETLEFSSQLE